MTTTPERFEDFLKRKDLRLTYQRRTILDAFLKASRHVSVEDLYALVRKKHPRIGQTTVFRTLKLLSQADIASQVELGDKIVRYEPKQADKHHDHLVCLECGECIEAVDSRIERLQEELCRRYKFRSRTHRMEIFGLCSKCAKRKS